MFDQITPEQFHRETSAVSTQAQPKPLLNLALTRGEIGFNLFVDLLLQHCRDTVTHSDEFRPIAVLGNAEILRHFVGEEDETSQDMAARLKRESDLMGARWCFVAMIAPAATVHEGDPIPQIDQDDEDAIFAALESGQLALGVCWSATMVDDETTQYRGGVMYIDGEGDIDFELEDGLDASSDPFHGVLT